MDDSFISGLPPVTQVQGGALIPVDDPDGLNFVTRRMTITQLLSAIEPTSTLPSQTGHQGKYLTTDGTQASWVTLPLLPGQLGHQNKFLTTNGFTPAWATISQVPPQLNQSGKFLTTDGTQASWEAIPTLPDPTGHSGKFLTTDGTNVTWGTFDPFPDQTSHDGKFLKTLSNVPFWEIIREVPDPTSHSGKYLRSNGTDATWESLIHIPSIVGFPDHFLHTNGTDVTWQPRVDELPTQAGHGGKYLTTNGTVVSWASLPTTPTKLTTDITYFVRLDGNDSNPGTVNDSSGAFRNPQRALDEIQKLDIGIHTARVYLNDVFPIGQTLFPKAPLGGGWVELVGPGALIGDEVGLGAALIHISLPRFRIDQVTLSFDSNWSGTPILLLVDSGSILELGDITFGALTPTSSVIQTHVFANEGSTVRFIEPYTITGGGSSTQARHILARHSSTILLNSATITGSPVFHTFAQAEDAATIECRGAVFTGSLAPGCKKFHAARNGVVFHNGNANLLPGSVPGDTTLGGVHG